MNTVNIKVLITEYRQAESDDQRSDCLRRMLTYSDDCLREHSDTLDDLVYDQAFADHGELRVRAIWVLKAIGYEVALDYTYPVAIAPPE